MKADSQFDKLSEASIITGVRGARPFFHLATKARFFVRDGCPLTGSAKGKEVGFCV